MSMQVEYKLKLGQDEFTIKAEVKDEIEFFERMAFYSNLPRTGPNGEDDLKLSYQTTKEGYNYYSLVSQKAGKQFKFGQRTDKAGGGLFPKGWSSLYGSDDSSEAATQETKTETPAVEAKATTTSAAKPASNSNSLLRNSKPASAASTEAPKATANTAGDIINKYAVNKPAGQDQAAPAPRSVNSLLRR